MSSRPRIARIPWWVAALIAVQVSVPSYALLVGEQPRRLGFQMFSGLGEVSITAVDAEGDVIELPETITDHMRVDLPWAAQLPEQICEVEPQAVRVTVVDSSTKRSVTC